MPRWVKRSPKTLLLIRHAHRNKSAGRKVDNGLSAKGKRQAKDILDHFEKAYHGAGAYVVSSPKMRCVETVMPIAKLERTELQISSLLDEQGQRPGESHSSVKKRVNAFCQWWMSEESPPLTVACSHGDWIPLCLEQLTGAHAELAKGGWAEIIMDRSEPSLVWLLQGFD